jgi:SAM-dependent methyltransferase
MNRDLLEILACPCGGALTLTAIAEDARGVENGALHCGACGKTHPITKHVPRFVPADSYANSFGFQWNTLCRTQLDSTTGLPISRKRFFAQSRWSPEELRGKRVLDVGCGAGRFAEIALGSGARLVAVDYSSAVDAAFANLGPHENLDVVQASVYELPLKPGSFDYVYCFGVLQHTPDPHASVLALAPPLKAGGKLALDFYPRLAGNLVWPKYWLRPLTRRMRQERLFGIVQRFVPKLLPVTRALAAIPGARRLGYLLPVMSYYGIFPFTEEQHREWAILDTFDMLAPAHDHPQTARSVRAWLAEAGLREIEAGREGLVVGRAVR